MPEERRKAREKILLAAINCIEKSSLQACTIRRIAKEAGVNSAAINYYFGSKEKLVHEALARTLEEFGKMPDEATAPAVPLSQEFIESLFQTLMEGIFRWPGIAKAHLYGPMIENKCDELFIRTLGGFIDVMLAKFKKMRPGEKEDILKMRLIQMISAVLVPGLTAGMFPLAAGIDFSDPAVRKRYVSELVIRFFG